MNRRESSLQVPNRMSSRGGREWKKVNKYTTITPSGMTSCSTSAQHIIKMAPGATVIK